VRRSYLIYDCSDGSYYSFFITFVLFVSNMLSVSGIFFVSGTSFVSGILSFPPEIILVKGSAILL
jgi:hypothetical protein